MVDLPIPGSPPISMRDPLTMPPPRIRSISPIPVVIRSDSFTSMPDSSSGLRRGAEEEIEEGEERAISSSRYVFHSLHAGQWPIHFGDSAPQFWHTSVSYTHLRAHETDSYLVCRLLLEKKKK